MEITLDGCQDYFLERCNRGRSVHKAATRFCDPWERVPCLQIEEALYRLKQAPRAWYARIDSYLMSLGFTKSNADPNLYYKVENGCSLILVLYMNDLFLTRYEKLVVGCKRELASEFEMKDLGLMHYFLGLELWQGSDEIFLSQGKYIVETI
jgi:hypothetical protein